MPTREEKNRVAQVWRVTLHGKPAANRWAISKLEAATGKTQQKLGRPRKVRKKGSAIVSVQMAEEDVIMLCFDPPRKYDTVIHFLQNHLKNRMLELAPVGGTADVEDEDGPCSLTQGHLEDHILQWLQADPYWEKLGQRAQDNSCKAGHRCMEASEVEFKHEEGGYVGRSPPGSKVCNTMDMSTPFPATRVSAWTRCFLQLNRNWLVQLTEDVRNALRHKTNKEFRSNGAHFFNTCFSDTALTYGVLQVMKPSDRYDPAHFDGGAPLLHRGLTILGSRHLECMMVVSVASEEDWEVLPQRPGSFYVGNLCAPCHRVGHLEQPGPLCAAAGDVHVAVMLRTDVFRAERSRAKKCKPKPVEVRHCQ